MIFSIAEAAKANNLNNHEYFEHLLSEIPKHQNDKNLKFLDDLLLLLILRIMQSKISLPGLKIARRSSTNI